MATGALVDYLNARQALSDHDSEAAALLLESAIASPAGNPVIRQNLPALLDHDNLAGEAILELLRVEIGRSDHDDPRE